MKEKRKLRIVNGQRTLTTYRRFRKRFPRTEGINYNRHTRKYETTKVYKREKRVIYKKPKKEIQREIIREKRIRKQVVFNFRSSGEPYALSIRALTINPEITERGLQMAVAEVKRSLDIDFKIFSARYLGFEQTEISSSEDKRLNDYKVHIEVLIKRNPPINFIR